MNKVLLKKQTGLVQNDNTYFVRDMFGKRWYPPVIMELLLFGKYDVFIHNSLTGVGFREYIWSATEKSTGYAVTEFCPSWKDCLKLIRDRVKSHKITADMFDKAIRSTLEKFNEENVE